MKVAAPSAPMTSDEIYVKEDTIIGGGMKKPSLVAVRSAAPPRKPDVVTDPKKEESKAPPAPAPKNQINFFQVDGENDDEMEETFLIQDE